MMATRAPNPYYDDPNIAAIASNIRKAFVDSNPGQTALYRAHGRLYGLQADELERKARARSGIAGVFRAANGAPLTPQQVAEIAASGVEGSVDPKDPAQYTLYTASNAGQPSSNVARAFVGAGHVIGKDQAVTLEDRELVARRENDEAARRTGISAGATIEAARIRDAGEDRRQGKELEFKDKIRWDKPVEVNQGVAVYPNADDPRMKGVAPGSIPAPKPPAADRFVVVKNEDGTFSYRVAQDGLAAPTPASEKPTADRFVLSENPEVPGTNQYVPVKPNTPGPAIKDPKPATPPDISPDEVMKLERSALADVGAADSQWNIDSAFQEQYGDRLPAARQAAAAAYQKSRNAADGQAAYLAALGIAPGSKWDAKKIMRQFGATPSFTPPKGAASPVAGAVTGGAAPAPAAPPAAVAPAAGVAPPAPANPAQRVPGQTYQTGRGPMTWTGTGWVPPANVR